eukprot:TRINITY_DN191_c0_g1_i1.p1 TRINITY_DN191_c0_g1~~TRINITY_DN191_c0_g1_i1.p1  ORF type:complete len:182 (-),score=32.47 TRINITY_DN191_c0_g1_i1:91-576(-)
MTSSCILPAPYIQIEETETNALEDSLSPIMKMFDSWLEEDHMHIQLAEDILLCIRETLSSMGHNDDYNVILPIIYVSRFIDIHGRVTKEDLFHLLLISTIVTVKFWQDTGANFEQLSYISGLGKKTLVAMEKGFLQAIDYNLNLSVEEIELFRIDASKYQL